MAFKITIDPDRKWVEVVWQGAADADTIFTGLQSVAAHPDFQPGFRILVDTRKLDYTPSTDDVKAFAEFHARHDLLRDSKVAIVATKVVDLERARIFANLCSLENLPCRSFRSHDLAVRWLEYGGR